MNIIKFIARVLIGVTFIFSGFVKGIDPLGSAYKFTDYFYAMNLGWMVWSAFLMGIIMAFAEFAIGVALLFNIKTKFFSWPALLFMVFFTGLTLWIAFANPVSDCGCFGDALVLSNWATFYKNVVLIILTIIVFKYRNEFQPKQQKPGIIAGLVVALVYCILAVYSHNHLPVFDFRPYKVGVNLPDAMSIPPGAPTEEYKNIFYYKNKKTGKIKKFNEQDYPWQDTINWEYHNIESKLVKEGYEPPVHDFTIETRDGENIIDFYLNDERYVFMLIAYDLDKAKTTGIEKIATLASWAGENSYPFIGLTSSPFDISDNFVAKNQLPFEFFNCDEITLKTIIRSNPGLLVIKDGTIIGKWHNNDIPSPGQFSAKFLNK